MKKTLLTLGILAVAAALSTGCATQKTRTGRNTNVLAGALTVKTGDYTPVVSTTLNIDGVDILGRTNPSGTQISALWGLITYTDY